MLENSKHHLIKMTEKEAIRTAVQIGGSVGYGNVIAHLRAAWAMSLIKSTEDCESVDTWTEIQAANATNAEPYPISFHEKYVE